MNRLTTIATVQKQSRARDLVFACCMALAGVVAVTSVQAAARAASTHTQR